MEQNIKFSFNARYFLEGNPASADCEEIWWVFHGYGQLAAYFLNKFDPIFAEKSAFIAPEGLSHFYLQGVEGRVGSSWMTREDRDRHIQNYCHYLDTIHHEVGKNADFSGKKRVLFGFSQGVATAIRWAVNTQKHFDKIILWAGNFPPDLDQEAAKDVLADASIHLAYGSEDPYVNHAKKAEIKQRLDVLGLSYQEHTYTGDHRIDTPLLEHLAEL